jgi:hypothetical protein
MFACVLVYFWLMKVTMLAKDGGSGEQGCDSFYIGEDGPEVYASAVNLLPGERIVGIDMKVILDAVDRYRSGA